MTLRFLLDTNVVSEPATVSPNTRVLTKLREHDGECAISAPVWHELTYGVRRLPRGKRRTALETYLAQVIAPAFVVLPYDETAAAWHGEERARLERAGKSAPFVDGQIAAIAFANNLELVTANARDFAHFRGVRVVSWSGRSSS